MDMTCVSPWLTSHKLSVPSHIKPVQQKCQWYALKRSEIIKHEVELLFAAHIIFEVKYPTWLANPVVMAKPSGGLYMCVDYTNLNKNCP